MGGMRMISLALGLLIMVLLAHPARAGMGVERRVMPGGLVVLLYERHELPMVVASLLVRGGEADVSAERSGLAALTASLLTRGTATRSATRISEEIEFMGASLEASGGMDYSTLGLTVLGKDLEKGFELMADALLNPVFEEAEFERERELARGSLMASLDRPGYLASRAFREGVYGDHPYARDTRGAEASLGSLTRDDAAAFHKAYYRPGGAILAVAGDVTWERLEALISAHLGGWAPGEPPKRDLPPIPGPARRTVFIDRPFTQATIMLGHLGVERSHPDYYALSVMNYILGGGGFSSRLMDRVRDELGLTYGIHSAFDPALRAGLFYVSTSTKNESAARAVRETLLQIGRIRETLVSDEELADARSYLTGSFPRRMETLSRAAGFLVQVEYYGLGQDYPDRFAKYINAVTAEDVLRVAKRHLRPEAYLLVIVGDGAKATGIE